MRFLTNKLFGWLVCSLLFSPTHFTEHQFSSVQLALKHERGWRVTLCFAIDLSGMSCAACLIVACSLLTLSNTEGHSFIRAGLLAEPSPAPSSFSLSLSLSNLLSLSLSLWHSLTHSLTHSLCVSFLLPSFLLSSFLSLFLSFLFSRNVSKTNGLYGEIYGKGPVYWYSADISASNWLSAHLTRYVTFYKSNVTSIVTSKS